ncbi:MAG: hypothetical protein ACTSVT_09405 [Candidatus Thorarchaeota archaeon]
MRPESRTTVLLLTTVAMVILLCIASVRTNTIPASQGHINGPEPTMTTADVNVIWSFTTGFWMDSSPALGDVDGDGDLDVVIGSYDDRVYALDASDESGRVFWQGLGGDVEFKRRCNLGDVDPDHDSLSTYSAHLYGTNPLDGDTDDDGMPDGWEVAYSLDPLDDNGLADADDDRLTNLDEFRYGTDPRGADTDGDLLLDGWEAQYGLNPTSPLDMIGLVAFTVISLYITKRYGVPRYRRAMERRRALRRAREERKRRAAEEEVERRRRRDRPWEYDDTVDTIHDWLGQVRERAKRHADAGEWGDAVSLLEHALHVVDVNQDELSLLSRRGREQLRSSIEYALTRARIETEFTRARARLEHLNQVLHGETAVNLGRGPAVQQVMELLTEARETLGAARSLAEAVDDVTSISCVQYLAAKVDEAEVSLGELRERHGATTLEAESALEELQAANKEAEATLKRLRDGTRQILRLELAPEEDESRDDVAGREAALDAAVRQGERVLPKLGIDEALKRRVEEAIDRARALSSELNTAIRERAIAIRGAAVIRALDDALRCVEDDSLSTTERLRVLKTAQAEAEDVVRQLAFDKESQAHMTGLLNRVVEAIAQLERASSTMLKEPIVDTPSSEAREVVEALLWTAEREMNQGADRAAINERLVQALTIAREHGLKELAARAQDLLRRLREE